ncbi:hypothetical protein [Pseudomonas sp. BNK-30]|uniref:hypothetical protein n=1 Tax=Pseudomonas sp. BNK-30 TaxID=3376165 RepID=UPI0039BEFECC
MVINFSPVRMSEQVMVDREGDVLRINGEVFDFGPLLEGATLPVDAIASEWFAGSVDRIGGELHITLALPHGADAPEETRFPQPIIMDFDGAVPLPPYNAQPVEDSSDE